MVTLLLLAISCQVPQDTSRPPPVDAPLIERTIARDLSGMSREEVEQEGQRLRTERPKYYVPAAVMIAGGVTVYGGLVSFIGWIAESLIGSCISFGFGCSSPVHPNPSVVNAFLYSGFAAVAVGAVGLIVGGVLLKLKGVERAPYSKALEAIDARIEAIDDPPQPERPVQAPGLAPEIVPGL